MTQTTIEKYISEHNLRFDELYQDKYVERIYGEYYDTDHYQETIYNRAKAELFPKDDSAYE